jgi:phosphonate transport system substrate-binding protein
MSMRHFIAGAALLAAAAVAQAAPRTLTIATSEGSTPGSAAKELAGVLTHLNTASNLKFTLKTYPTYDATYDAFKRGEAELMLVGSVKYVQAHSEIGAIPVVVEEPRWQESVVVVAKGSPLKSVGDLKGKKFAFGYADSTTTHLLPLLLLSKYHLTAADLGKTAFLGSDQTKIVDAVVKGQSDAGAVATAVYDANKDRVRALETSERIPGGTVVAHKELDAKLLAAVRSQFLSYKPAAAAATGPRLRFPHGAAPAADADYNKVRFLCKVLFKKTYM